MPKITLVCARAECGKEFQKSRGEYNRRVKLGKKLYCSMGCFGKDAGKHNIPADKARHPENLRKAGWQFGELSPFKMMFNSARTHARNKGKEFTIELADLLTEWNKQNGICPLTGWSMVLHKKCGDKIKTTPDRASLDRIDSAKGYVRGNVRFVSLMAQYAKNGWVDEDVVRFARAVATRASTS